MKLTGVWGTIWGKGSGMIWDTNPPLGEPTQALSK